MNSERSIKYFGIFLDAFGIKQRETETDGKMKYLISLLTSFLHPFPIFLHLSALYNFIVLSKESNTMTNNSKAAYSCYSTIVLSLIMWHMASSQSKTLHSLLKNYSISIVIDKNAKSKYLFQNILVIVSLTGSFLIVALFSTYAAICTHDGMTDFLKFWFVGYSFGTLDTLKRLLIFTFIFISMGQQIFFPSVSLIIFCTSTMTLVENLEQIKESLKTSDISKMSLTVQSRLHKELLTQIKKHERLFSLPIFLMTCLFVKIGFTGIALEMDHPVHAITFNAFEGILYLYFCFVGVSCITYCGSRIPSQLKEIKEIYEDAYESSIDGISSPFSLNDVRNFFLLKTMCEREVVYLTAWNVIRLEKSFAFTFFGTLITYGILIIQLNKNA